MRKAQRTILRRIGGGFTLLLLVAPVSLLASESIPENWADDAWTLTDWDPAAEALWLSDLPVEPASEQALRYIVPSAPVGLLAKLRSEFSLEVPDNARVRAERDWFVRHPDYLNRVFNRSQRYMPHIVAELEARGLPMELALLPIVESAYDPFAYSHGRAAGLWQIIPGTARRFGIEQNWWYDGRRDVVDATRGALEYLAYLHELMDGDWELAVASYNSGEGNVLRAKRRNEASGKPADFWNLKLSKETSAYVPRLMALVDIVKDPAKYNLELPRIENEPQFAEIDIEGQLDLALAAELAGVELDTLYAFNAGLNRWATDPDGPHRLYVPLEVANDFSVALTDVPKNERLRWQRHKIRNGETLSSIALKYHTTLDAIREANDVRGTTIHAGDYLMIPVASQPLGSYGKSADQRLAQKQNQKREGNRVEHYVASGESFWSISRKYGVSTRQLAGWNGMAPGDTLPIGRKLVVWTNELVAPASGPNSQATTRKVNYTVRKGDSLSRIANRFRITVADILRWNNINKDSILRPGQRLTMFVDVTRQSS